MNDLIPPLFRDYDSSPYFSDFFQSLNQLDLSNMGLRKKIELRHTKYYPDVEVLETERCYLRPTSFCDINPLQAICNNPNVAKSWPDLCTPFTHYDAEQWLMLFNTVRETNRGLIFAITDKHTGEMLGIVMHRI